MKVFDSLLFIGVLLSVLLPHVKCDGKLVPTDKVKTNCYVNAVVLRYNYTV